MFCCTPQHVRSIITVETDGENVKLELDVDCGDSVLRAWLQLTDHDETQRQVWAGWVYVVLSRRMITHEPLWIFFSTVGGEFCGGDLCYVESRDGFEFDGSINGVGRLQMTEYVSLAFSTCKRVQMHTGSVSKSIISSNIKVMAIYTVFSLAASTVSSKPQRSNIHLNKTNHNSMSGCYVFYRCRRGK